jgi:hypothetical protein
MGIFAFFPVKIPARVAASFGICALIQRVPLCRSPLNPLFVSVNVVNESREVGPVTEIGLFLALVEACLARGIVGEWTTENFSPMRGFFFGRFFNVFADPVTNFTVGDGVFDDLHKLFVGDPSELEPSAVETFSEIAGVIGVQLASEVEADFIDVAGEKMPAIHRFSGTARINNMVHSGSIQEAEKNFKFEFCSGKFAVCILWGESHLENHAI